VLKTLKKFGGVKKISYLCTIKQIIGDKDMAKKNYSVSVDIVMSKYISVEAESDEEAAKKVDEMITKNPYDYTSNFACYVGHEVISTEEE